jgi:hypothetical protein
LVPQLSLQDRVCFLFCKNTKKYSGDRATSHWPFPPNSNLLLHWRIQTERKWSSHQVAAVEEMVLLGTKRLALALLEQDPIQLPLVDRLNSR